MQIANPPPSGSARIRREPYTTPAPVPATSGNSRPRRASFKVNPKACIHYHMVNEGYNFDARADALGFRVQFVFPKGLLDRSGLKADDVVVALDGKRKLPYADLRGAVALEHNPGETFELTVLRAGKEVKVPVSWK